MKQATLAYGFALIVLGVAGYVLTGAQSVTALIPAFFGLPMVLLGLNAEGRPAIAVAALVLALLGLGGSAPGLGKLGTLMDGSAERPAAVVSQSVMAVLSVTYVVAWFVTRKRRQEAPAD